MGIFKKTLTKVINGVQAKIAGGLSQEENGNAAGGGDAFPGMAELVRNIAAEGAVLLKNDGVLPVAEGKKIAVFGRCQYDWFYVGYGSGGDVHAPYKVNLIEGLKNSGRVAFDENLANAYKVWCDFNPVNHGFWAHWPRCYPEMPVSQELLKNARQNADIAVVIIGRAAGEDRENNLEEGSYYLTADEKTLLDQVTSTFDKTVVLLNIGNIIDMEWVEGYGDKLSAVMLVWQGGMESGNAVVDLLSGDCAPSGRLPVAIARKYADYPSANCFGNREYNYYKEDIYVGYRYFETFNKDAVLYPFGYGLDYTTFETDNVGATRNGDEIKLFTRVLNSGENKGRYTLQVYLAAPQGALGKPARVLVDYAKTRVLKVGESENLELSFKLSDFASYDDGGKTGNKAAYVLEKGEYTVYAGTNSRSATPVLSFSLDETQLVRQLTEVCAPKEAFDRTLPEATTDGYKVVYEKTPAATTNLKKIILENIPEEIPVTGDRGIKLADVKSGKNSMDEFIAQLSDKELEAISRGDYSMNSPLGAAGNAGVFGGVLKSLRDKGVPAVTTTDGPSGIRLRATCSLLPIGTLLAATFDSEAVYNLYKKLGEEMRERGSDVLLAPGMNIMRNPLCGRNFEYFSEEPYLSGMTAAAFVGGLQSAGVSACPKHFACNNQETNRNFTDSRVSERALREIYLKGFEICVKVAKPLNIMTSYNKINGVWSHYNFELCHTVLRGEWNYDGSVMTDWWMRKSASPEFPEVRDNGYRVRARVDVLMPGANRVYLVKKDDGTALKNLNKEGGITRAELQRVAADVLGFVLKCAATDR